MAHWEYHLEKSFIKKKAQVSSDNSLTQTFSTVRGRPANHTCQSSVCSRTYYFEFWLHFSHLYCTVSIPRPTKFWVLFINYPVSHQAGNTQLQEEEIPRSQKVTVLFLFLCSGQGITRQLLTVPGYHGNTRVLCSLFPFGSLFSRF